MAVVARYNADGSLDPSFGTFAGVQLTSVSGTDHGAGIALQPDGKIVAVGATYEDFLLARYNPNGSPDPTFSDDGTQTTDFGESAGAGGVALQPDGKIVVAGAAASGGGPSGFALARYEGGSALGTAPANASPPTISGTATDGQTLTVSSGAWTGSTPINRRYQWRRCDSAGASCVDIAAATAPAYPLTAADVGRTMRVRETATNAYGTRSVDSAATAVVKARAGAIAGKVKSASSGAAIGGASVNCGTGYSAATASNGTYSIANAPPGTYSCTASAKGHRPLTRSVTVASGQTATANFSLPRS